MEFAIPTRIKDSFDQLRESYNKQLKALQEEHKEYFDKLKALNDGFNNPVNLLVHGFLADKEVPEHYTYRLSEDQSRIIVEEVNPEDEKNAEAVANNRQEPAMSDV